MLLFLFLCFSLVSICKQIANQYLLLYHTPLSSFNGCIVSFCTSSAPLPCRFIPIFCFLPVPMSGTLLCFALLALNPSLLSRSPFRHPSLKKRVPLPKKTRPAFDFPRIVGRIHKVQKNLYEKPKNALTSHRRCGMLLIPLKGLFFYVQK